VVHGGGESLRVLNKKHGGRERLEVGGREGVGVEGVWRTVGGEGEGDSRPVL